MPTTVVDSRALAARESFLEVRRVSKLFGEFVALHEVSMIVAGGEFVSILGPSGCGKTTLLRVIAGLEEQSAGQVFLEGRDVSGEPPAGRRLGIVFQSYALFPNLSIINNVAYGIRRQWGDRSHRRRRALEMLELVGLEDQALKYPAQLSGGQQQRVALARALAPNPSLLLLDEPLSALDARVRGRLRLEIRKIQRQLGITTVMVTHDQEEALTMADRVMVLKDGVLMQFAPPRELYRSPGNAFVAGFIGAMNFLEECRRLDASRLELAGHEIALAPGAAAELGSRPTLAIRPEDVVALPHRRPARANQLPARIEQVEFRGSLYRFSLVILTGDGFPGGRRLALDLQLDQVENLGLSAGSELCIELPPEKILLFPASDNVINA